jgi:hypothetical protein
MLEEHDAEEEHQSVVDDFRTVCRLHTSQYGTDRDDKERRA